MTRAADGSAVAGARVSIVTRGESGVTDEEGRYAIELDERVTVYLVQVDATETSARAREVVELTVEPGQAVRLDLQTGAGAPVEPDPETFTLTGRVLDALTNAPVPYVRIVTTRLEGEPREGEAIRFQFGSFGGGSLMHRSDGEDGRFRCDDLELGSYVVFVDSSGYVPWWSAEHLWYAGDQHLDVWLYPERTLDLDVVREDGSRPEFGIDVAVRDLSDALIRATVSRLEGGEIRLEELPADVLVLVLAGGELESPQEVEVDLRAPLDAPLRVVLPGQRRVRVNLMFHSADPSRAGERTWLDVPLEIEFLDEAGARLASGRFAPEEHGWDYTPVTGTGAQVDLAEPVPLWIGWAPPGATSAALRAEGHVPTQLRLEGENRTQQVTLARE